MQEWEIDKAFADEEFDSWEEPDVDSWAPDGVDSWGEDSWDYPDPLNGQSF